MELVYANVLVKSYFGSSRTQSIVSVSDAVPVACGSRLRRRRNTKEKLVRNSEQKSNGDASKDLNSNPSENPSSVSDNSVSAGTRRSLVSDFGDGATPKKSPSKADSHFRRRYCFWI